MLLFWKGALRIWRFRRWRLPKFCESMFSSGRRHLKLVGGSFRGYPCGFEEVGTKRLADCLKQKGWASICGYLQKPPSNLKGGDILIYASVGFGGWNAHPTKVNQAGSSPKITCHSDEQLNIDYNYLRNSKPYSNWLHFNSHKFNF